MSNFKPFDWTHLRRTSFYYSTSQLILRKCHHANIYSVIKGIEFWPFSKSFLVGRYLLLFLKTFYNIFLHIFIVTSYMKYGTFLNINCFTWKGVIINFMTFISFYVIRVRVFRVHRRWGNTYCHILSMIYTRILVHTTITTLL